VTPGAVERNRSDHSTHSQYSIRRRITGARSQGQGGTFPLLQSVKTSLASITTLWFIQHIAKKNQNVPTIHVPRARNTPTCVCSLGSPWELRALYQTAADSKAGFKEAASRRRGEGRVERRGEKGRGWEGKERGKRGRGKRVV